ncbi:hypothetical protein LSAT2_007631 [Lamellibrachia satsuma]|nr:hypothetical protein LSAT2_007631 [Lamellibrachia satsuma]
MREITADGKWHDFKMTHYSVENVQSHEQLREEFIQHNTDSLKARFPQTDLEIFHNIDIGLNSARYPNQAAALRDYGNTAVDIVISHFGKERATSDESQKAPVLHSQNARREFSQLKTTLKGHGRMNFEMTCGLM